MSTIDKNSIDLNENMKILGVTIKETFDNAQNSEKVAYNHMSQSVIYNRDCGLSLIELGDEFKKASYTKKKFYDYVDKTFGIKERMNQRYMQLGKNKRTKDVDVDFFSKMNKPTLTNVITALSFSDDDWNKVISGDDTPFKPKKLTDAEKNAQLKKEFDKKTFENLDFEQFKTYMENSKMDLIEMIDKSITQSSNGLYLPNNDGVVDTKNSNFDDEKVGV